MFSWGQALFGALGVDSQTNIFKPVKVSRLKKNIIDVSAGEHHSLFLAVHGSVYACGEAEQG